MRAATGLIFFTFVLGACGGERGGGSMSGTIAVDGSSTVYPISEAVAEEFALQTGGDVRVGSSTVYPISEAVAEEFALQTGGDVRVTVGVSGTGGGFKRFCAGETDISNASRPIRDSEAADCAANGVEYTELTIAIDGLTVAVN